MQDASFGREKNLVGRLDPSVPLLSKANDSEMPVASDARPARYVALPPCLLSGVSANHAGRSNALGQRPAVAALLPESTVSFEPMIGSEHLSRTSMSLLSKEGYRPSSHCSQASRIPPVTSENTSLIALASSTICLRAYANPRPRLNSINLWIPVPKAIGASVKRVCGLCPLLPNHTDPLEQAAPFSTRPAVRTVPAFFDPACQVDSHPRRLQSRRSLAFPELLSRNVSLCSFDGSAPFAQSWTEMHS